MPLFVGGEIYSTSKRGTIEQNLKTKMVDEKLKKQTNNELKLK